VFAPGDWGRIVNGGAWLDVDGARVDRIYRDLNKVLHWTSEAQAGRFHIEREVGYVAGIATYVMTGELAQGKVLAGELPRPTFPRRLQETAPPIWYRLASGAMHFAEVHALRGDRVACLANLTQAVLAAAEGRLAAAAKWALNEKRIVEQSGLDVVHSYLADRSGDLAALRRAASSACRRGYSRQAGPPSRVAETRCTRWRRVGLCTRRDGRPILGRTE
jgi:hypothetical protein